MTRGLLLFFTYISLSTLPIFGQELLELEVDGISVRYDERIPVTKEFLEENVLRFKSQLENSLLKDRFADDLADESVLYEVGNKFFKWSRGRIVPELDVEIYKDYLEKEDIKKKHPNLTIESIEIRDREDTIDKIKSGVIFDGLSYRDSDDRVLTAFSELFYGGDDSICFVNLIIVVNPPNYELDVIKKYLDELAGYFEETIDYQSNKLPVNYLYNLGLSISRHNFKFIGMDQRWFHEGYAGMMCFSVLNELIGEEETIGFLEKYFPFEGNFDVNENGLYTWNEEIHNTLFLQFVSYKIFLQLHIKYGHEIISDWLDALEDFEDEIIIGKETARTVLEKLIGQPIGNIW